MYPNILAVRQQERSSTIKCKSRYIGIGILQNAASESMDCVKAWKHDNPESHLLYYRKV